MKWKYVQVFILIVPHWDKEFPVHTNASNLVVRAMLAQNINGKCNYTIAYASHLLNTMEQNYTTIEWEVLAMVYVLHKFKHYFIGSKFGLYMYTWD